MMIRLYFILLFVAMFTLFESSAAMRLRRDATTTLDANSTTASSTAASSTEMTPVSNTSLSQETSSGSSIQVEPIVSSVASSSKTSEDTNNVDYNAVPNDTDDEQNTDADDEGNNELDSTYVPNDTDDEQNTDTDDEGNNELHSTLVPNDTDDEKNTDTDDEGNNDLDNTHGPDYEQPIIDPEYEGNNEVDNTDVDNGSPGDYGSMDGASYGGDMNNSSSMGWVPMEEEYEQGYDDDSPYQGGFILNTPFFAVDQVERYFMHLERAVEHIFRNVMNEMGSDPNVHRNSSDRVVDIDGHKFNVHTSIINGGDENNSVSVQAVSAVPINKRRKRSASLT